MDAPKLGVAGAASGGDILFHEVCAELGIPTHVYLALPENSFINESVAPAEGNWVERFRALLQSKKEKEVRQLAETDEMPKWLRDKDLDYGIWQRNNLWMLHNALALGGNTARSSRCGTAKAATAPAAPRTWWIKPESWERGRSSSTQKRHLGPKTPVERKEPMIHKNLDSEAPILTY